MLNAGQTFVQKSQYITGHIPELSACPRCLHCYPLTKPVSNLEK